MRRIELIAALAALAIAAPVMAQGRGRGNGGIPPGQRPAAGMCRIWIDGVPPGRQPAPTDCATAAARVPYNGRIIYGDRTTGLGRRVYEPNGQIITGGQSCIRRADEYGRIQTICPNDDGDRDDRIATRTDRNGNRIVGRNGNRIVNRDENRTVGRSDDRIERRDERVEHKKSKVDRDRDDSRSRGRRPY